MDTGLLRFEHIYASAPWGGRLVSRHFGRTDAPVVCSESWEISGHSPDASVIADGPYAGRALDALVREFCRDLVGTKSPTADRFPLLFKLIDARWPLSIQVHPNDENAALTGGEPKSEAWYVIKAFPGAVFYAGFKHPFEERDLRKIVAQGPVLIDQLNPVTVAAGNLLHVPGGMPHAIGGGCFIYEVQQSSDTTYRLYDWDRADAAGNRRPLHVEQSFRSIDYSIPPPKVRLGGELRTPHFTIREVSLTEPLVLKPTGQSFIAVFVLSGATNHASFGESILLPACGKETEIRPMAPETKVIVTEL